MSRLVAHLAWVLALAGPANASEPDPVLATFPGTVHGQLAFTDDGTLIEVNRALVTVYAPGQRPFSYSADGPFVNEGSSQNLTALRRGPNGLWAVFAPQVGIPRNRLGRPETPTWHLPQGVVNWAADPEHCWMPVGADRDGWLAAVTTTLDCTEPTGLERFAYDGESRGRVELPPGFRLGGHDTRQIPVAALGTDVVWAIAGGELWRHDGEWTVPFDGEFTHVVAQGERVLAIRQSGGWSLRSSNGQELMSGEEPVLSAVFSEDGRWLAVGLKETLLVLDAKTGQDRVPPRPGRYQAPHAFSAQGDLLAVAVAGRPTVLGFDGAALPTPEKVRFRGAGLVARSDADLACRGSIAASVSGPTAQLIDAHHGLFSAVEAPVTNGVARFDDVPCGAWRVASSDFVDVRVGAAETLARSDTSPIMVVGADRDVVEGARVRFLSRHHPPVELGFADAKGQVLAALGPFGVLMAETDDAIAATRSSDHRPRLALVPKESLWRVQATDDDNQPVAGVVIEVLGTEPRELNPDFAVTNDNGEAWLPLNMRSSDLRVQPGGVVAVDDNGVFRTFTRSLTFDPVDDGLELLFVDALGVPHRTHASQGHPHRELRALPAGSGRLEAWRGDACATMVVEGDQAKPPEPDAFHTVMVEVRFEDGRSVTVADIWRGVPADPLYKHAPRTRADDQGQAEIPVCSDTDLFAAMDYETGRWGFAVGPGPLVLRWDHDVRPALVLGAGGVVSAPAPTLGLKRFDRVRKWGRKRTKNWTAEEAALAVWSTTEPVKVKVRRRDGDKAKLVVPPPTAPEDDP